MKISSIESMAHKPGMYRVSVDTKPLGYITAEDIFSLGLVAGADIQPDLYTHLLERVKYAAHYAIALAYADRRLRSKDELNRYLKGRGCDQKTANAIVSRLLSLGIIDETKLAAAYVHDTALLKPTSRNMLALKLRQKRIDPEVIDSAIESAGYDEERALDQLVSLKSARYADNQLRFFRYLMRQGFGYSAIEKRIGRPKE